MRAVVIGMFGWLFYALCGALLLAVVVFAGELVGDELLDLRFERLEVVLAMVGGAVFALALIAAEQKMRALAGTGFAASGLCSAWSAVRFARGAAC